MSGAARACGFLASSLLASSLLAGGLFAGLANERSRPVGEPAPGVQVGEPALATRFTCGGNRIQGTRAAAAPDRLIARFRHPLRASAATRLARLEAVPIAPALVPGLYRIDLLRAGGAALAEIEQAQRRDEIEYLHPDYYLYLQADGPSDTDFCRQWSLQATEALLHGDAGPFTARASAGIEALAGWRVFPGKGGLTVAVIDSGLRVTSHEFEGTLWTTHGRVGHDFVLDAGVLFDSSRSGHGTSVAAIIGAGAGTAHPEDIVGVSPGCRIMPLRTFEATVVDGNSLPAAPTSRIIAALDFAAQHAARITNNSYGATGIGDARGLLDAIEGLQRAGVLFVCSAGNGGRDLDTEPFYPASFDLDNMLVVTSTGPDGRIPHGRNFGAHTVDLAAPGEEIYAPADIWGGYGRVGGTSFATAHVSGAAALVWEFMPEWDYAQVRDGVRDSVRRAPWCDGRVATGGVLNLKQLMRSARAQRE